MRTDSTAEFFEGLVAKAHDPVLEKVTGSMRFEVTKGSKVERWLLEVRKGDLAVSRKNARADCVVRGPKAIFDELARGETNAMTAMLRGAMAVEGDVQLLVLFQRLLPGPPNAHGPLFGLVQRAPTR